jgi:hypothetical protein
MVGQGVLRKYLLDPGVENGNKPQRNGCPQTNSLVEVVSCAGLMFP